MKRSRMPAQEGFDGCVYFALEIFTMERSVAVVVRVARSHDTPLLPVTSESDPEMLRW